MNRQTNRDNKGKTDKWTKETRGTNQHLLVVSVSGMLTDITGPVSVGGKLEMMRVRATDPRPCPKCGKIYRSAHTLRTHMEDKHTICPGYRCVLCGTVAKSRNSLHSHMSRQHRGISTKDLPVLPMPAPFDPDLASKLLSKAGVKVKNIKWPLYGPQFYAFCLLLLSFLTCYCFSGLPE